MARIILGSYLVRCPLGGYLSWVLQWLVGFQRLGHDVYFVEKATWPDACYDPSADLMTDDGAYGTTVLGALLARFGLQDHWCFADVAGRYHGLSRDGVEEVFKSADLFVDMGTHGTWLDEAEQTGLRVLVDGDPGYTQIRALVEEEELGDYDYYYSVGRNIAAGDSTVPTLGKRWRQTFHPVVLDLFAPQRIDATASFTTMMFWQSYRSLRYNGATYGQKDVEFEKFIELPRLTTADLELTLAGHGVPGERLEAAGWRLRNPLVVTKSFDSFRDYVTASRGEFSVCKNVYVATNSGWFSDKSAAYLASGRPVVLQDTGFSAHLPCGEGLFAVRTVDEAAAALEAIDADYERHSQAARDLAAAYLDTRKVLGDFLAELGV